MVSPGSATAAVPDSERAKAPVPKTGPAPENDPGMVPVMARDPAVVLAAGPVKTMVQAARETGAIRVIGRTCGASLFPILPIRFFRDR